MWKRGDPADLDFSDASDRVVYVQKGDIIAYCCLSGDETELCYGWIDGDDGAEERINFTDPDWMQVIAHKWASMNMRVRQKVGVAPPSLRNVIWVATGKIA